VDVDVDVDVDVFGFGCACGVHREIPERSYRDTKMEHSSLGAP